MLPRIFISHSDQDKGNLEPVLSALIRRHCPLFIDQKRSVPWSADVRPVALDDEFAVQSIGNSNVPVKINNAINTCGLFALLYTDSCVDGSKVWDELRHYLARCEFQAGAPKPLLVQSAMITRRISIPKMGFLKGHFRPNVIKMTEPGKFWSRDDSENVASLVQNNYTDLHSELLTRVHVSNQENAAKNENALANLVFRTKKNRDIEFALVSPLFDFPERFYISHEPVTKFGPDNTPIDETAVQATLHNLPDSLHVVSINDLRAAFLLPSNSGSIGSPYGLIPRKFDDPVWVMEEGELSQCTMLGRPSQFDRAYLYLKK